MSFKEQRAFTMVQLVIAIGVFAIISAAAFMVIDPAAKINAAKDQKRRSDVLLLSKAFKEYAKDHKGALPVLGEVNTSKKTLCISQDAVKTSCGGAAAQYCLTLDDDFFDNYLSTLPFGPDATGSNLTEYYVQKYIKNGRENLIVGACNYSDTAITHKSSVKVTCEAYGGGYCWYNSGVVMQTCEMVCNNLGMDCVSNGMPGDDSTNCMLNNVFQECTSCLENVASGPPPSFTESGGACISNLPPTLSCNLGISGKILTCPCE